MASINDIPRKQSNPLGELNKHPAGSIDPRGGDVSPKSGRASPIHPGMTRQQRSAFLNDVPLASYPDGSDGDNPMAPENASQRGKDFRAAPVHPGMRSVSAENPHELTTRARVDEDYRVSLGRAVWDQALRDSHDTVAHQQTLSLPNSNSYSYSPPPAVSPATKTEVKNSGR